MYLLNPVIIFLQPFWIVMISLFSLCCNHFFFSNKQTESDGEDSEDRSADSVEHIHPSQDQTILITGVCSSPCCWQVSCHRGFETVLMWPASSFHFHAFCAAENMSTGLCSFLEDVFPLSREACLLLDSVERSKITVVLSKGWGKHFPTPTSL